MLNIQQSYLKYNKRNVNIYFFISTTLCVDMYINALYTNKKK